MDLLAAAAVFLFAFVLAQGLGQRLAGRRQETAQRLSDALGSAAPATLREKELGEPFSQRLLLPLLRRFSHKFIRMLPPEREAGLEARLTLANLQGSISAREFLILKYLAAGFGGLLGWSLTAGLGQAPLVLLLPGLGWYGPDLYLSAKCRRRQQALERGLPDVLDLLTVSVEAGLGFDGALLKVAEKSKGPLAEEFSLTLQEIRMGRPRAEALRNLASRTRSEDLSTFTGAVILADQLGLPIGNVLRLQAEQIRLKRRQRAEEAAMKAPIKMLFPMIFFIFPAIFVILLGPAAIQIANLFLR